MIYLQNNGIFYSYQQYQTMYTSFKFLEQYTTFGTIKDLWKNGTHRSHFGITEFIDSEIYSKNMDLLPDLSNMELYSCTIFHYNNVTKTRQYSSNYGEDATDFK